MNVELKNGSLTNEQIKTAIKTHDSVRFERNRRYMNGENDILRRVFKDVTAPHNNVPISYGRKIIKTVSGYMYKPGLISLMSENEEYLKALEDVYWENNEDTKTTQLGEQVSLQGRGFEIHFMDGTTPRFAQASAVEMIPIHDISIEPELVACIRRVKRDEDRFELEVYYADRIDSYWYKAREHDIKLISTGSMPHEYEAVPVVMYQNNGEQLGDFEPIIGLIDSYDRLISDSVNEADRFAWAYLILKGMSLKKEDAEKVKEMRIFQNLTETGDVSFLTKDIPSEFFEFMAAWIRKEIHKQSHVPDFADDGVVSGGLSGVAMDRMLYDFEFIAATKEMYFKDALYHRLGLLNTVMAKTGRPVGDTKDVQIVMSRNKVTSLIEQGDAMQRYAGHVSQRTLIGQFAPFVKNVEEEIDAVKEDQEAFGTGAFSEEEGEPEGATKEPVVTEDVQAQALNGAQIKSVVDIASMVAQQTLPAETAISILKVAIPSLSDAEAAAIINPAEEFKVANVPEKRSTESGDDSDQARGSDSEGNLP